MTAQRPFALFTLTVLILPFLASTSWAETPQRYPYRSPLEEVATPTVTIKDFTACSERDLAKLPALGFGHASAENLVVCPEKESCRLEVLLPQSETVDPVRYYHRAGKICEAATVDPAAASEKTFYRAVVEIPNSIIPKDYRFPAETDQGTISAVQKDYVFTTITILYRGPSKFDLLQIGKTRLEVYF